MILERTVTEIAPGGDETPRPLAEYRRAAAYVLLGDPGAGKTTAFRTEAARESAICESVRDFLALDPSVHPEWKEGPLFLDGLDEARAGCADGRTPLDRIRGRLDRLGRPPFRLSCREADWFGNNDRKHLETVSRDGNVVVLRLDSLGDADVRALVEFLLPDADSGAFLNEAWRRGMEGMLRNPQTLELVAKAYGKTDRWPETQRGVMEAGTMQLAQETNVEHRIPSVAVNAPDVLQAAGWISELHLLCGGVPHGRSPSSAGADGVLPDDYGSALAPRVRGALGTRLFAARGEGRFEAVHANLAAFLAARTLADRVSKGLPGERVLSLLVAPDGAPPTPLRGLAAWLAALCPALRRPLIERDPAAVLMYGDVAGFSTEEKTRLVRELARDPYRLHDAPWSDMACQALADHSMAPVLLDILEDGDRSDANHGVALLAVWALGHGPGEPASTDALRQVVRDSTRDRTTRAAAFDVWVRQLPEGAERVERLRSLLDEFRRGTVADPHGELLGSLLDTLYPGTLAPHEVWEHLAPPSRPILGRLWKFLNRLGKKGPDAHLPEHLDTLASSADDAREKLVRLNQPDLAAVLLARAVQAHGDRIEIARLVAWLRLGLDERGFLRPSGPDGEAAAQATSQWLAARPGKQKGVIRLALRTEPIRSLESPRYHLGELLYRSELPEELGRWHLEAAVRARSPERKETHLQRFVHELSQRPVAVEAALAQAHQRLGDDPDIHAFLDRLLRSRLRDNYLEDGVRYLHVGPQREEDVGLLVAARSQRKDLDRNSAAPQLLDALARNYYRGLHPDGAPVGLRHVTEALGGDERLGQRAVRALSRTIERPDLPSVRELLRLWKRDRLSWFVWPVLVGLTERDPGEIASLEESRLRTALACRLLQPGLAEQAPWYQQVLADRPDLVSEVLVAVGRVRLTNRDPAIEDFGCLAADDHGALARRATLPLLKAFPARAARSQLQLLDQLLWAGLRHLDPSGVRELGEIVAGKASQPSTTKAARIRWMAAGLLLDPKQYIPLLSEQLSGVRAPLGGLEAFFRPLLTGLWPAVTERLSADSLAFLIRTFGPHHSPRRAEPGVLYSIGSEELVDRLIGAFSWLPGPEPTRALEQLRSDAGLAGWRPTLERALSAQRVLRRDANHVFPEPAAVIAALRNRAPANASDLRALVVDRMSRLDREMRTTNANQWRQFWNESPKSRQVKEPRHENSCRDALLAMLRPLLPEECDAQPEGQYAKNRRADIRVSFGCWNVPVEIKKNGHPNLWRAASEQLLASYATDPATEGLGIYLVLWFGPDATTPLPLGRRPMTPGELREAVIGALTPDQRRRAAVVVMDVTPPADQAVAGRPAA